MSGINEAMMAPSLGTAGITALMGMAVVFFGLILLMIVVMIMGKIMVASRRRAEEKAAAAAPAPAAPAPVPVQPAKGTAGKLMLHDVPPRDAALIMAIVAYRLQTPINELRFRSIKEVKD